MKFRGKIADITFIQSLTKIISVIHKINKTCTLRLTTGKLYFFIKSGASTVWCEVEHTNIFNEYILEGLSAEYNEIFFEINIESVFKILKSSHNAKWIKIKLTKKQCACITFEVELPSSNLSARLATHDIPVTILPRRVWPDYEEPETISFDVSISMPALKNLKKGFDPIKSLSPHLIVSATRDGTFKLGLEEDLFSVTIHFADLEVLNEELVNPTTTQDAVFQTRIDIRHFSNVLQGYQINPNAVVANILDEKMLQVLLVHDEVTLQYYIPAIKS